MPTPTPITTFLSHTRDLLRSYGMTRPTSAVVLGSGLGDFVGLLQRPVSIPTSKIPGYPSSTVQGHSGWIHYGVVKTKSGTSSPMIIFQGRIHPYEGGPIENSSLNIEIAKVMGVRRILLTNAAGGLRPEFTPGNLMLHEDIISIPTRFLRDGIADDKDPVTTYRTNSYDERLKSVVEGCAKEIGVDIVRGVYCYLSGPTYETPAEVRMLRTLGADAVGMSTIHEVVAARKSDLPVVAVSLISNLATGISQVPLSHADVTRIGKEAGPALSGLLASTLVTL